MYVYMYNTIDGWLTTANREIHAQLVLLVESTIGHYMKEHRNKVKY